MFSKYLIFLIMLMSQTTYANSRIRTVQLYKDQIVTVRTALGVATIIQVPDRPNSLVVGDQSAFKVEYLDQAITIKPLRTGVRSNLYIYTDYRRFNVQLVTSTESQADYVVYLENPKATVKSSAIGWRAFHNHLKNDPLVLQIKRLANTADGILLVEFEMRSRTKVKFNPAWVWLTQKGAMRPIHSLALSAQDVQKGHPIKGIMQIRRSDVSVAQDLRIELRRKKISYLTIPKRAAWK